MPSADDKQQGRSDFEAATSLVKQRDRDRYWSTLFAPNEARDGLISLYAFNAELHHVSAVISEPMVGQIRLQWWRDAIELAAPGRKTGNPVADALAGAIIAYGLPKDRLLAMVDARAPEISGEAPADIQALRASLRDTSGAVFELAAAILGSRGEATRKAAEQAGLAYGLTRLLVAMPLQATRGKLLLPPSYFESRGVDAASLSWKVEREVFTAALADLRGAANRGLQQFRSLVPNVDPSAWPAFLILALVKPYLRAMAAPGFNPLRSVATVSPVRRFWRIWRAARLGRIRRAGQFAYAFWTIRRSSHVRSINRRGEKSE